MLKMESTYGAMAQMPIRRRKEVGFVDRDFYLAAEALSSHRCGVIGNILVFWVALVVRHRLELLERCVRLNFDRSEEKTTFINLYIA